MNILIEGENYENYIAKVHEACRTGLRTMFGAKCYGRGYEGYDENIHSFPEIQKKVFGNEEIDLLILTDCWNPRNLKAGFKYSGLKQLQCKKAIMLCDFWSEAQCHLDEYVKFIIKNDIDYIFSYFRWPLHAWRELPIYNKLIWYPVCFDPVIFKDWNCEKRYDVGNLNAGIFEKGGFYPERYEMHQVLLKLSEGGG